MISHLTLETRGQGLTEFTDEVVASAMRFGRDGLATVFVRHTSCSLLIQENADPSVRTDLMEFFARLVPPSDDAAMNWLTHTFEGPDDMPAHIKAALMPTSLQIPVEGGRLLLGTWQGIYLFEHRSAPMRRKIAVHLA